MSKPDPWPPSANEDENCFLCNGIGTIGRSRPCPSCQDSSGPMGLDGWITCHYLDRTGAIQRFTHLSTEPLTRHIERQEDIRAAMELMCRELGYEVLSVQLVILGADHARTITRLDRGSGSEVLPFPVRRGSSME